MADIRFEEEQPYQPREKAPRGALLIQFVLATGIVSTEKRAEYVLLSIAAIATVFSFFLISSSTGNAAPQVPPGAKVVDVSGWPPRLVEAASNTSN